MRTSNIKKWMSVTFAHYLRLVYWNITFYNLRKVISFTIRPKQKKLSPIHSKMDRAYRWHRWWRCPLVFCSYFFSKLFLFFFCLEQWPSTGGLQAKSGQLVHCMVFISFYLTHVSRGAVESPADIFLFLLQFQDVPQHLLKHGLCL